MPQKRSRNTNNHTSKQPCRVFSFLPLSLQKLGSAIQWITLLVSVTLKHWIPYMNIYIYIYMIFIYLQRQCFVSWIAALSKFEQTRIRKDVSILSSRCFDWDFLNIKNSWSPQISENSGWTRDLNIKCVPLRKQKFSVILIKILCSDWVPIGERWSPTHSTW